MATVETDLLNGLIEVPPMAHTFDGFREWTYSSSFPDRGRVTFVEGRLIFDMSPERYESHVKVKGVINYVVGALVVENDLGQYYPDGGRLINEHAKVSNEPDAMFASWETLETGKFAPPEDRSDGSHIDMVGTPDWVCEVVSDSSVQKDTQTLRKSYHRAGIPEYWLIDARDDGEEVDFQLLIWKSATYEATEEKDGWLFSPVFNRWFRIARSEDRLGNWKYELQVRDT